MVIIIQYWIDKIYDHYLLISFLRGVPRPSVPVVAKGSSAAASLAAAPVSQLFMSCIHAHPLIKIIKDNGWACDKRKLPGGCLSGCTGFNQLHGKVRYTCIPCDFDLCEPCMVATTGPSHSASSKKRGEFNEVECAQN